MTSPISLIIPVRNEGERTIRAVRSFLAGRSHTFPLEVIIVDDASTDGGCESLAQEFAEFPDVEVRVCALPQWSGIPYARNRGAELAKHPIFIITDANTCVGPNWDLAIQRRFSRNRLLAGTILDRRNHHFRGYGCALLLPSMGVVWLASPDEYDGYVPVSACTCTVIDRDLFFRLGGYDEALPLYGAAEPEFSVRAWLIRFTLDWRAADTGRCRSI
jgi:glycosyltransferase involved in cell wall biosynthesis